MKTIKIAVIFLGINYVCSGMKYNQLKEQVEVALVKNQSLSQSLPSQEKIKKEKEEYHAKFLKEYKKEFALIWNDIETNKKMYEEARRNPYKNIRIVNKTLNEFVLIRMQDSYKNNLKKFYPNDLLIKLESQLDKGYNHRGFTLQDQAEKEVYNYLNNETCTGCCWLLCLGAR